jgi:hypothetical protein
MVREAFKDFSDTLKTRKLTSDNTLVISVDEVHVLYTPVMHRRSPYNELCSVLSDLRQELFVVIFLSTSSQLSKLALLQVN